jgi:arsenate reductase
VKKQSGTKKERGASPLRVLFVCTGNAARSQMAEGLANHLGRGRVVADSAGTFPAGMVMRHAVAVMQERGIDISSHFSKGIDDVTGPFDRVVTLCDSAVQECPADLVSGRHEHWSTYDPSFADGGPDAVREAFRQVRDRLEAQIADLVERLLKDEPAE